MLHFPIELESTVDLREQGIFNTKQVISIDFPSIAFILLCKISIPPAIQVEMKRSREKMEKFYTDLEKKIFFSSYFRAYL
jgi:hypothetical protein